MCETVYGFWKKGSTVSSVCSLHTYIIGHYSPSVRIIDLVTYTTYFVRVNFKHKWWDLQFKVDSERQIFNLLSKFLPEICWEEIAEEILFVFCFDVWHGARILSLRLIKQHTTYYTTATSNLYHAYNNNYNNNCLVRYSYHTTRAHARSLQRWSSNHDCFGHTQLHTRLTELLLTVGHIV